jgi:hypothetical protein
MTDAFIPAVLLDPTTWTVLFSERRVIAEEILRFQDACLVREGDQWLLGLGLVTGHNRITCWQQCGDDLEKAIWAL